MLANELGRRDIPTYVLVDEKPGTAFNPQANATQARSMEHYRPARIADEIRRADCRPRLSTDVAYFTRYTGFGVAASNCRPRGSHRTRQGTDGLVSAA